MPEDARRTESDVARKRSIASRTRPLTRGITLSYCVLRAYMSSADFLIRPARNTLYRDVLGMGVTTLAMVVAIAKSMDFFFGFSVGYLSDKTKTRCGRRKPWIMICGPLWVVTMICLANPPRSPQIKEQALCNVSGADTPGQCPSLEGCMNSAIRKDPSLAYDFDASRCGLSMRDDAGLVIYFFIFYFFYFTAGWTSTMIPYDSLGMELTDDFDERSLLFGYRSLFQFLGYLYQLALAAVAEWLYTNDIASQVSLQSWPIGGLGLLGVVAIVCKVKERAEGDLVEKTISETEKLPVIPQALTLFQNYPYLIYIAMKLPLTWAAMFPAAWIQDYLKYCKALEDFNLHYLIVMGVTLISCVLWIPILVWCSRRYGRRLTMVGISYSAGVIFAVCFVIPPTAFPTPVLYPVGIIVALGQAGAIVVPDAILGDIIDYGELQTGIRSEGLYCVLETNAQQLIEIVGGVLPALLLGLYNFQNNGGCTCGCGTKCPHEYLRWNCPGDVGYACGQTVDAHLLYGDPERVAPCTMQPLASVWIIRIMMFGAPAVCFIVAGLVAQRLPISKDVHDKILQAMAARARGESAIDPVTQLKAEVRSAPKDEISQRLLYFTQFEHKLLHARGLLALRAKLSVQFSFWVVLLGVAVAFMLVPYSSEEQLTRAIALGSMLCAALLVLLPWDGVRLRTSFQLNASAAKAQPQLLVPNAEDPMAIDEVKPSDEDVKQSDTIEDVEPSIEEATASLKEVDPGTEHSADIYTSPTLLGNASTETLAIEEERSNVSDRGLFGCGICF